LKHFAPVKGRRDMKSVLAATVLLLAGSTTGFAATVWKGLTVVMAASGACATPFEGKPVIVGMSYYTVFRPKGLAGNKAFDSIALYDEDRAVFAIGIGGGNIAEGNYAYDGVSLQGRRFGAASQPRQAELTSFATTPETLSSQTRQVVAELVLADKFMGIDACSVSLRSTVAR
jgi:hypothetical protein